MVSITTWVISTIAAFVIGCIAVRIDGRERCRERVKAIVEEYGFKTDDNAGDA